MIALNRYPGMIKLLLKRYFQGLPNVVRNVPTKQGKQPTKNVEVCKRVLSSNNDCWPQSKDIHNPFFGGGVGGGGPA